MDRRAFLKSSSLVSTALFMPRFLHAFDRVDLRDRRILVVLQLSGGNDGLNTFIPFEDDIYYQNRPSLAIRKDEA
ncbi:MAG: twin-arginine translocation pathway signal, partial [Saprospiraceae bacterium]|nr:twin-arginine translocation pathway signal [Saprospiraceae bacterium]